MSDAVLSKHSDEYISAPQHVLQTEARDFAAAFNRSSFLFEHDLDREPLLTLPSLVALAERLEASGSYYWCGHAAAMADGWGDGAAAHSGVADAVASIEHGNALVMLKNVINDALFGPLFHGIIEQIYTLCDPAMREDVIAARATILIASPGRMTPYHADADTNFLMQIAGDKAFGVYSHTDRALVTDEEIEQLLGGNVDAMRYKPDHGHEAVVHSLRPGTGIHVPSFAPHWARNSRSVSIALSLNFDLKSVRRLDSVYRLNRRLRRFGLHPASPGQHPQRDAMKARVAGLVNAGLMQRLRGRGARPA